MGPDAEFNFWGCCEDDKVEAWPPVLVDVEVEAAVVFGLLPPVLFEIEDVVGDPTTIGGEGDWWLLGAVVFVVDDLGLAPKDIWV